MGLHMASMLGVSTPIIRTFYRRSVNGRTFYGVAKEKKEAAEEFQERIMAGENVGLVESRY